jgi:hypothetical protein
MILKTLAPYIGVTGCMRVHEVRQLIDLFPLQAKPEYKLMIGVLASSKSLVGEVVDQPGRYPKIERLSSLFVHDNRALNLVHYNTKNPDSLSEELERVLEYGGPYLDGFQLNVVWPQIDQVRQFWEKTGGRKIVVLQVGERAMERMQWDPQLIAMKIADYLPMVSYVLIDPSGGTGKDFIPIDAERILLAVRERCPSLLLGVAGGLRPGNMHNLARVAEVFTGISIDAEGGLRTPKPQDQLDLSIAKQYITEAADVLS